MRVYAPILRVVRAYDINIDIILQHTMGVSYPTLPYLNLFKLYAHVCTYRQKILIDCYIRYIMDFVLVESEWSSQDFRLINFQDASEMGVCYSRTKQTWITLHQHKSISTIINTSIEESIHQSISDETHGMPSEEDNMNVEQEEELVKRLFWHINDWI